MKKIIRLTESDLNQIIKNAVVNILNEEGLGGATSCAGVYDTASSSGSYENGDAQKKQVTDYPAFGKKPLRQKHNLGKKNDDFFGETTKRHNGKGGSISIPK